MHRNMLSHELATIIDLAQTLQDSARKTKYSSLINSLTYTMKQFFLNFENDAELYNTDRAEQVLNHYDMYHSYFKKHVRHTALDATGRIVDRYLFACAKLAEMQLQSARVYDAILKTQILKLEILQNYFMFISQAIAQRQAAIEEMSDEYENSQEETIEASSEFSTSEVADDNEVEIASYEDGITVEEFLADELNPPSYRFFNDEEEQNDEYDSIHHGYDRSEEASEEISEEAEACIRGLFTSEEDAVEEMVQARPSSAAPQAPGFYMCSSTRWSPTLYTAGQPPKTPANTPSADAKSGFDSSSPSHSF